MLWKLVLLLTLVPLVELLLLVRLTQLWGSFWLTVGIILGTGLLGAVLARREGLRVIGRVRDRLAHGELPADALLDGLLVLVAAALLITPGLLTDAVGFLLLIPPTRSLARALVKRWARRKIEAGTLSVYDAGSFGPIQETPPPGAPPLEDDASEREPRPRT